MADAVTESAAVRWSRELTVAADTRVPLTDPTAAYLGSLSPKGRQTMVERLRAVATLLGVPYEEVVWHDFRFQHVDFLRQRLLELGRSPATVNLTLAAFRGIARYARNLGLITPEEHDRLRDVKAARGSRLPAGRAVLAGELGALVGACAADPTPAGVRDAAIFAVLYIGGIRRSELAGLDVADWTPDPPTLRVRHGKGDKERLVPLVGAAARALDDWLAVRGDRPSGLFLAITRHHTIVGTGMTSHAVYNILAKRRREAGVAKLSPHDFRRTFVGDLLDTGIDLATVQQLAGHASVTTTARYDRRGEATKRRAVEVLHFPYRGQR